MIRVTRQGRLFVIQRSTEGHVASAMHFLPEEARDLHAELGVHLSETEKSLPGLKSTLSREHVLALPGVALEVIEAAASYAKHDPGLGWPKASPQAQARARFHRAVAEFRAAKRALNTKEPSCAEVSST